MVAAGKVHDGTVALDLGLVTCARRIQHTVAPPGHALLEVLVLAHRARLELVRRRERDRALGEVVQRAAGALLLAQLVVREER